MKKPTLALAAQDAAGAEPVSADAAAAQAALSRILPRFDAEGNTVEPDPPSGGSWIRDPDGGLRPADAATAEGAGLAAPGK